MKKPINYIVAFGNICWVDKRLGLCFTEQTATNFEDFCVCDPYGLEEEEIAMHNKMEALLEEIEKHNE